MSKAVWGGAVTALLCVLSWRVDAQKLDRRPIKPIESVAGSATFKAYCAQCHGIAGRGNGPAAKALKMPPADLTQIARRHGGHFPAEDVKQAITGDHGVAAHGTREMPMWGPVFRSVDSPSVAELRLVNLVRYLEQMQER